MLRELAHGQRRGSAGQGVREWVSAPAFWQRIVIEQHVGASRLKAVKCRITDIVGFAGHLVCTATSLRPTAQRQPQT